MSVTIRDIARKLNLSITAVSRALDGYPDISEATREKVRQAAQEMGYVPNRAARQLRRQKTDTIGYILPVSSPQHTESFHTVFMEGMSEEAAVHRYDLLISTAPPSSPEEQSIYQSWIQSHKVDGMIINRIQLHDWRVHYLAGQLFPFCALEDSGDDLDYPRVEVANQAGMTALVQHIHQQGYQRSAFIGGPVNLKIQQDRLQGYLDGLQITGLPYDPLLVETSDLTGISGYLACQRLLSSNFPPDAILCINDDVAFGVMRAIHETGLRVGRDIAVTGFDGLQESGFTTPSLTTVEQPVHEIGRELIRILLAEIQNQSAIERLRRITPSLQIRESTQK